MRAVRTGPVIGPVAQLALLSALAAPSASAPPAGSSGRLRVVTNVALARGLARSGSGWLGPADRVTFVRATLVGGVAALTAASFTRTTPVSGAGGRCASVALVLDAVDGWVARRTHSASALGARFDMEVDAFLILVLSVYVARSTGWWVLAIGIARYAFVAAGWLLPWLRGPLPPRYWRKVVAASSGHRADVRGGRRPAPVADGHRARRFACAARRVVRRRGVVAVAPPAGTRRPSEIAGPPSGRPSAG